MLDYAAIGAGGPLAPIVHQGCVFTVGTEPPTFTRICHGVADQTEALTGADPGALRLRLVNGWVWINDLTNGTMWIAGTDIELERIDDWGNALGTDGDDPDEEQSGDDEETDTEENPDIGEIRDQEIDEDGINEPPVARDDIARTRVDQPVVVDVVANDEDPDGDALMVTEITGIPEGTRAAVTADQGAVQVIPAPGASGRSRSRTRSPTVVARRRRRGCRSRCRATTPPTGHRSRSPTSPRSAAAHRLRSTSSTTTTTPTATHSC